MKHPMNQAEQVVRERRNFSLSNNLAEIKVKYVDGTKTNPPISDFYHIPQSQHGWRMTQEQTEGFVAGLVATGWRLDA